EKAVAVYHRIAEHDPENQRARVALDLMEPREATAEPGEASREAPEEAPEELAAPAVPSPAASPPAATPLTPDRTDSHDFIDLGSLISEGEIPRDTRMRVEDEEPTGDEEKDFADLLQQFKRGIDENVAAEDYQSHYDLGVAFKEMGLLDEAIAEFQKALRAPEVRLRTSEALGVCFVEKHQHAIAEAILRRAVEGQAGSDDEKVGLLYWLGRALEAQQRPAEALACYQRVMAVDIRFADTGNRMQQVTAGQGS
ncbi:MAG: tetratricopeptide repeat protein, partial [Gemmatimonadales bacterium]